MPIYEEQQMMKPYVAEIFESFVGSFYTNLYDHLMDEMKNKQFVNALMAEQLYMKQQLQPILDEQFEVHIAELASVEGMQQMKHAYSEIAFHCAQFQKKVAKLLNEHFPGKYPDYFYAAFDLIEPLEHRLVEIQKQAVDLSVQNDALGETVAHLEESLATATAEYTDLQGEFASLSEEMSVKQSALSQAEQQNKQLKQQVSNMMSTVNEFEVVKKDKVRLQQELFELTEDYSCIEDELEHAKETMKRLTAVEQELRSQLSTNEAELQQELKAQQLLEKQNNQLFNQKKELDEGISTYEQQLAAAEQEKQALATQLEEQRIQNTTEQEKLQEAIMNIKHESSLLQTELEQLRLLAQQLESENEQQVAESFLVMHEFNEYKQQHLEEQQERDTQLSKLRQEEKLQQEQITNLHNQLEQSEIRAKGYRKEAQSVIHDLEGKRAQAHSQLVNMKEELTKQRQLAEQYRQQIESQPANDLADAYERLQIRYETDVKKLRDTISTLMDKQRQQEAPAQSNESESEKVQTLEKELAQAKKELLYFRKAADKIGKMYNELLKKQ